MKVYTIKIKLVNVLLPMNNLDNLVQQPTGCGEQNMVKFAPLVSVTKYLRDTAQLNSKVSELAKEYLKIGKYLA